MAITAALCLIFSMSPTAFASSVEPQDSNTITLRTEEDWEIMRQNDLAEYNAKLANISPALKEDVEAFLSSHSGLAAVPYSENSNMVCSEDFLAQFVDAYPEYAGNMEYMDI